jgi:hypothetical protein
MFKCEPGHELHPVRPESVSPGIAVIEAKSHAEIMKTLIFDILVKGR